MTRQFFKSMLNKKISVIIGNYNTYDLTKTCIESIYKYSPKFPFEVIVIDDMSPDGSGEKLKKLEKYYKQSLPLRGKISIVSLPRDIWIEAIKAKLNTAYYYGGLFPDPGAHRY